MRPRNSVVSWRPVSAISRTSRISRSTRARSGPKGPSGATEGEAAATKVAAGDGEVDGDVDGEIDGDEAVATGRAPSPSAAG